MVLSSIFLTVTTATSNLLFELMFSSLLSRDTSSAFDKISASSTSKGHILVFAALPECGGAGTAKLIGATPSTMMSARVSTKSDLKMFFRFVFMFFTSILFFTAVPFYTLVVGVRFLSPHHADSIRVVGTGLAPVRTVLLKLCIGFANIGQPQGLSLRSAGQ